MDRTRSPWRSRGRMWPIRELAVLSRQRLWGSMHYEIALAMDLFLGSGDRTGAARKMLKISGAEAPDEIADKAWNAAWDFNFIRQAE